MARPKIVDYDPGSDEQIVTEGVEGCALTWLGFDIDRQVMHIVCEEGALNVGGDGIETATRTGQQETLEGVDVATFYTVNKTALDSLIQAALEKWVELRGKTGSVVIG